LSWIVLPVVGAILAVVLGHMAKSEIQQGGGAVSGDGLAVAGLVLGYANLGLAVVGAIAGVVLTVLGIALPFGLAGCGLCAALFG
jgi:hypothetical protein